MKASLTPFLIALLALLILVATVVFFFKDSFFSQELQSVPMEDVTLELTDSATTTAVATTSVETEEVTKTEQVISNNVFFQAKVVGGEGLDTKTATVDVFVSNGFSLAGGDSFLKEVITDGSALYSTTTSSTNPNIIEKNIELKTLDQYDKRIKVYIVGREEDTYTFSGELVDEKGGHHPFTFSFPISEQIVDEYTFNPVTGEVARKQIDYSQPSKTDIALSAAQNCDGEELQQQLKNILEQHDFPDGLVLKETHTVLLEDGVLGSPFRIKSKPECNAVLKYIYKMDKSLSEDYLKISIMRGADEIFPKFEIYEKVFTPSYADGPLSSFVGIPIQHSSASVQFLNINNSAQIIPISFPMHSTCPCEREITISLTAPITITPKEN